MLENVKHSEFGYTREYRFTKVIYYYYYYQRLITAAETAQDHTINWALRPKYLSHLASVGKNSGTVLHPNGSFGTVSNFPDAGNPHWWKNWNKLYCEWQCMLWAISACAALHLSVGACFEESSWLDWLYTFCLCWVLFILCDDISWFVEHHHLIFFKRQ